LSAAIWRGRHTHSSRLADEFDPYDGEARPALVRSFQLDYCLAGLLDQIRSYLTIKQKEESIIMNRILTVSCLVGILASVTAGVQAGDKVWNYKFQGGTLAVGTADNGSTVFASSSTVAGVIDDPSTKDLRDSGTPAAAQVPVVLAAWYRPEWNTGAGNPSWAFLTDTRTPLGTGPIEAGQSSNYVKTWKELVVWTSPGFNTTAIPNIFLHVFPATGTSVPPSILNGHAITYRLVMTQWPAGYVGEKAFVLSTTGETLLTLPSAGTVAADPISGSGPLAVVGAVQTAGYRFNFVTPEPGSLLALGAGLVSLLGVSRRRR